MCESSCVSDSCLPMQQDMNNSSELPASLTSAVITFHHVTGVAFLLVNALVCILIVFDNDRKGQLYRKYLLSLQLFSTLMDLFGNAYAPIVLINCRLIFSDTLVAKYVDIAAFGAIEVFLVGGVATSYFACVHYRRCAVLPRGSRFCFDGWRRLGMVFSLQAVATIIATLCFVLANVSRVDAKNIPAFIHWVTRKSSFIFHGTSQLLPLAGCVTVVYYLCISVMTGIMIGQVLKEIKNGMHCASAATKRYQKRAVVTLTIQGLVPKLMFIAPIFVECILYLNTLSMEAEEAAINRQISIASALVFNVITTHTLVHSIVILACTPPYRKTLSDLILLKFLAKPTVKQSRSVPISPSMYT